jgi:hypothetical protein
MEEPTSLDSIQAEPAPLGDENAKLEETWFNAESKRLELAKRRAELDSNIQDTKLRGQFTKRIFLLILGWLSVVLGIIIFQGFKFTIFTHSFGLSNAVLLALIGSTTANVLGVFVIVVHYLFPDSKIK